MGENQVKVTVVADQRELDGAIDLSVTKLKQAARDLDIFNKAAVEAFFSGAEAAKKMNVELGASVEQMAKLDAVTQQVAEKADAAGTRTANAFERGARGMSVMARQGTVTARSLNQIIAAGADIAFAFGPEGAIVSGILMVTAGIIAHLETTEQKMVEVVDNFNEQMADMVANSSPVEIARKAANAYISELEAQAKLIRDEQMGTWKAIIVDGNSDALFAKFRTGGDRDQFNTKHAEKTASDKALGIVEGVDGGSTKALEDLKKERERLNKDIAGGEEHLRGLDKEKNAHEIEEAEAKLSAARNKLADTEALTRQIEKDRDTRLQEARNRAILGGDGVLDAALEKRGRDFAKTDLAGEHAQREEDVGLSSRGGKGKKQDVDEAKAARERETARERESQGELRLIEIEDQAIQRHLNSLGLKDLGDMEAAEREYARQVASIEKMKVSEDLKTRLMIAALEDRNQKLKEINHHIEQEADKSVHAAIAALDKQLKEQKKSAEEKARVIEHVETGIAHALVAHHKDMGREILRALLEPEVKHLEALGAKNFVIGSADAALGNYKGAAEHFAAGALYMAGATAVAAIGGTGGGGSGGGTGGGGGAGNSSAAGMGARGNGQSDQIIKLEIVTVTRDQTGREVAKTTQMIQRLNDLNQPIRVTM